MSCGIYKIENNINHKIYIGQSKNIEKRWKSHIYGANNEKQLDYNRTIHKAFRKYGVNNFNFSIIEELKEDQLLEREIYWINYYDSYNNGYNETPGGEIVSIKKGSENGNAKLTEQDVFEIRSKILEGASKKETYETYFADKISFRQFSRIWQGEGWDNILPEAIKYVKTDEYLHNIRSKARKSQISSAQKEYWKDIKMRKEKGEKRLEVYKDYENIYSIGGFNKIWYKKT